jgi:hypothetical protein
VLPYLVASALLNAFLDSASRASYPGELRMVGGLATAGSTGIQATGESIRIRAIFPTKFFIAVSCLRWLLAAPGNLHEP